jgi:6-phosphogluconolactonase (cycloisomerase 2 family)
MRTRLTWIVAILALVSIGVLMACSTKYTSSSDGLVVIPSQGSLVMESFSLDVNNGRMSEINNVNGPPTPGLPTAIILDPAGAFAYVIVTQNASVPGGGVTGIATFPVGSDGKLAAATTYPLNNASVQVLVQVGGVPTVETETVPVAPVALTIDSAGKLLFVANTATSDSSGNSVPGSVSVFAIGNNASLAEVAGSPFVLPVGGVNLLPQLPQNPCTVQVGCPSPLALAVSSTAFPPLYAYCSAFTAPTTENLYVPDSISNTLLNYSVSSSGTLTLVRTQTNVGVPTGYLPDGVAVDPCNRFVYVSNGSSNAATSNTVSAYTICNAISLPNCPNADFSLLSVNGSPFPVSPGDGPGPLAVDAFGSFLYVVDTASGLVSQFRISPTTGSLTALTPPFVAASVGANSIAVRNNDSWVFVADKGTNSVLSQYAINVQTGNLVAQQPTQTFNYPSGVAVK